MYGWEIWYAYLKKGKPMSAIAISKRMFNTLRMAKEDMLKALDEFPFSVGCGDENAVILEYYVTPKGGH